MFTQEKIEELHKLCADIVSAKEIASEQLRTAQDRTGDRVHKLKRKDGTTSNITEKVMWDEVFYMGAGCESGQFLKQKHPEVFKAYAKQDQLAIDLKKFCLLEFGIDYTQMTISDYLKLTEGMFEYMLNKYNVDYDKPENNE